jgi:hypothetical protein
MTSQDKYGAAVHEAGHVVVAWALGLKKPAGRTGGAVSCGAPVKAVAIGMVAAVVAGRPKIVS